MSTALSYILHLPQECTDWQSQQISITLPSPDEEALRDFDEGMNNLNNGQIVDLDVALTQPYGAQI